MSEAGGLKVFCTTALNKAMEELAPQFERAGGHKLVMTFASAASLAKRVAEGEDADVAIVSQKTLDIEWAPSTRQALRDHFADRHHRAVLHSDRFGNFPCAHFQSAVRNSADTPAVAIYINVYGVLIALSNFLHDEVRCALDVPAQFFEGVYEAYAF